jgi:ketosteroid isomerase-like protein
VNNSYILLLLTVMFCTATQSCKSPSAEITPAQKAEVVSEIQQRLDDYATAVTSKDLKGQLSFWSDSLVFAGDGIILGGLNEWAPIMQQNNDAADRWVHWTWDNVHILPLSRNAGSATVEFTYQKILVSGDTVNGFGSWTYVLKRNSEGWQVYQSNGHHLVR